ncbi:MAG: hypothetical protein KKD44_29655 [Proteobacteria bacterium]|nr:hypothetical protein [Pseudomonadota bacterium]
MVQDQYIMGQMGPISINQLAVHKNMELYEVTNPKDCLQKVMRLARWWVGKNRNES